MRCSPARRSGACERRIDPTRLWPPAMKAFRDSMSVSQKGPSGATCPPGWAIVIASLTVHIGFLRVVLGSGDKGACQATKVGSGRPAVDCWD
jgi:hypothetical protein